MTIKMACCTQALERFMQGGIDAQGTVGLGEEHTFQLPQVCRARTSTTGSAWALDAIPHCALMGNCALPFLLLVFSLVRTFALAILVIRR
jgi:hypothetical protein